MRLKIDGEEDWEHAQVIYEALGRTTSGIGNGLPICSTRSPRLRKRMAVLNRAKSTV